MATSLNPSFVKQINDAVHQAVAAQASYLIARVAHVVLGPYNVGTTTKDPYYKNPTDIGSITVQLIQGVQDRTLQSGGNPTVKPMHSAMKHLPLEGELVLLIPGPSTKLNESRGLQDYYYMAPFNIWNASHHNAFPDLGNVADFSNSTEKNYNTPGLKDSPTNLSVSQSASFPLGPAFAEKSYLKSLLPFIGDFTLEGRWGNSIRFGSTTEQRTINPWSSTGSVGSPIMLIRNGQGRTLDQTAWVPTIEDINRDAASIYLTNGQKIVIDDIQNSFSLASLGVALESAFTISVPLQQALTSYDNISPAAQDQRILDLATPATPTAATSSTTTIETVMAPVQTPPPEVQVNTKGTYIRDYTNTAGNVFELYSKKVGFTTTVYAYLKSSGAVIRTDSSTSSTIQDLARRVELALVDNSF